MLVPLIRDARDADLETLHSIYAHHVLHGTASFETTPPGVNEFGARRHAVLAAGLPFLVAEQGGELLGYCYAAPYRARPAYRQTIENSVYVGEGCQRSGIGRALLNELVARCEAGPWRQMLAVVGGGADNAGSLSLHRACGFREVGTLRSVGFKFGRWLDTVLMQRALDAGADRVSAPPRATRS